MGRVTISIGVSDSRWRRRLPAAPATARRAARAALAASPRTAPRHAREIAITLADDATLRRLNRVWRGKDRTTNVLAFPAAAPAGAPHAALGDVVVALGQLAREARRDGKRLGAHLSHLVVHGVLHLLGHDHVREDDAARMEAIEVAVLKRLGISDPYRARPRRRR